MWGRSSLELKHRGQDSREANSSKEDSILSRREGERVAIAITAARVGRVLENRQIAKPETGGGSFLRMRCMKEGMSGENRGPCETEVRQARR